MTIYIFADNEGARPPGSYTYVRDVKWGRVSMSCMHVKVDVCTLGCVLKLSYSLMSFTSRQLKIFITFCIKMVPFCMQL